MVLCVSGPETIGHGPTASPTGKLNLRIPRHGGHDSMLMADSVPS
jgi:hypothetical protein